MICYIGLGSNLGKRQLAIRGGLRKLGEFSQVLRVSTLRQTAPVGGPSGQRPYINAVVEIETSLLARELLVKLLEIERSAGRDRQREVRFGPRTLDLDLLLYGTEIIDEPELMVPHPRMHERGFVLEPLCEIAPHTRHPILGQSVEALWEKFKHGLGTSGNHL